MKALLQAQAELEEANILAYVDSQDEDRIIAPEEDSIPLHGHEKVSAYLNNASASSLLPPPGFSMIKPVGSVSLPLVSACPAATAVSSLPLPYSQVSNGPNAVASLPNCLMSPVIGNSSANIKNSCPIVATSILPSGMDSYGPATAGLSPHVSHFRPEVPSVMNQQPQCAPCNDIVQLAAYLDLLTFDGGQSFDGDPLQYHLFLERLNSGVLRIFGNSNPGVALQIVMKSCSGDALSAIRDCAAILDKAVALKQALVILARLFGSQRSANDGHIECVCESRVVNDDVKDLRSLLIDKMTCQQVLVNNVYGVQLDSIDTTQKVCRRLPFKLREKVREIASKRSLGRVLYQDLIDIVNKRLDQLDTCYAESNKDSVSNRAGGNIHVS